MTREFTKGRKMKETPRRRKTVTSSSNEVSTDQLGKRAWMGGGGGYSAFPHSFLQQASVQTT
jgi:hypothetical protein